MHADDRGDMGFMESIVAMLAVVTVAAAFIGVLAYSAGVAADPTDGIDPGMVSGTIADGEFVPGFEDYAVTFAESRGLSGISVSVKVPGGFCAAVPAFTYGSMDGSLYTRVMTSLVPDDNGRSVLAIFEVTACARTTPGSWR